MTVIHSMSISARITLDLHSLNNEGTEGNQQQTRMVRIIDQKNESRYVNAISGDMFKHILVEHLVPLLKEAKQPLSEPAARLSPDRITADAEFKKKAGQTKLNADLLDYVLQHCSLTDLAGALYAEKSLPRKSVAEFGWVVGLPAYANGEPITSTEQFFHVKYAPERGKATGGDSVTEKQAIFHRPASSGIYALICNLDLYRIGLNDITREPAVAKPDRERRAKALIHALAATLLKPAGAQRNTQNPHIVNCEGIVATSATSLPAPTVSPLHDDYREEIGKTAAVLNAIRPDGVQVVPFASLSEGVKVLADIASAVELTN
jgi:CRISPR-associated protein Cst2